MILRLAMAEQSEIIAALYPVVERFGPGDGVVHPGILSGNVERCFPVTGQGDSPIIHR